MSWEPKGCRDAQTLYLKDSWVTSFILTLSIKATFREVPGPHVKWGLFANFKASAGGQGQVMTFLGMEAWLSAIFAFFLYLACADKDEDTASKKLQACSPPNTLRHPQCAAESWLPQTPAPQHSLPALLRPQACLVSSGHPVCPALSTPAALLKPGDQHSPQRVYKRWQDSGPPSPGGHRSLLSWASWDCDNQTDSSGQALKPKALHNSRRKHTTPVCPWERPVSLSRCFNLSDRLQGCCMPRAYRGALKSLRQDTPSLCTSLVLPQLTSIPQTELIHLSKAPVCHTGTPQLQEEKQRNHKYVKIIQDVAEKSTGKWRNQRTKITGDK